jgi:hypothetical protein
MKKIFCITYPGKRSAVRRRHLRTLLWRQRKSRFRGGTWRYASLTARRGPVEFVRLATPATISLNNPVARAELLRFLAKLKRVMLNGDGGALVDFRLTQTLHPSGTMLLFAEIDRINRLVANIREMRCRPAENKIVDQVLEQTGVYKRFNHSTAAAATHETVIHWRQATGVKVDGQDAGYMLDKCEGRLAEPLKQGLFRGVTEAMTNSVHHAYVGEREDGTAKGGEKRWWLFSEERDGFLSLVICDLGIGIPKSLPKQHTAVRAILNTFASDRADVEAIKLASELGKTSTSLGNRGKGLPEILDAARQSDEGSCIIFSNRGQFGFAAGKRAVENQFTGSIYGTLIVWRVPITEGSKDVE